MDLTPDPDQLALVAATSDWCRAEMPIEQSRNRPPEIWQQLEVMGWTAMTATQQNGGLGVDHASEAIVFAELGSHLAPVGLIASAVASHWSNRTGKAGLVLPSADGNRKPVRVFDPADAEIAIGVIGRDTVAVRLPAGLRAEPCLDLSTPMAMLEMPQPLELIADNRAALHLQLLSAAFALGCADAARDMAAQYALMREQFERPIGWFQAIKHLCADMTVRCAVARSQLLFAAAAFDSHDAQAAFHIGAAKHLADKAAMANSRTNIQVHGGIGMTDEASPHLCLKRAHLLSFIAPSSRETILGVSA